MVSMGILLVGTLLKWSKYLDLKMFHLSFGAGEQILQGKDTTLQEASSMLS